MSCDDFYPAFLLYNGGKLNAFGWVTMGDFQSERYEHPPSWVLGVSALTDVIQHKTSIIGKVSFFLTGNRVMQDGLPMQMKTRF